MLKPSDRPTAQPTRQAADAVGYELRMLVASLQRLHNAYLAKDAPPRDGVAWNGWGECFLLHARNLIEFSMRRRRRNDSDLIHATTFDPGWPAHRHEIIEDEWQRLNTELAHLSARRVDDPPHADWDPFTLASAILESLDEFHATLQLRQPERAEWFSSRLHQARQLLDELRTAKTGGNRLRDDRLLRGVAWDDHGRPLHVQTSLSSHSP